MTLHHAAIRSTGAALLVMSIAACGATTDTAASPTSETRRTEVVDTQPIATTTTTTASEPEIIDSVTPNTVTLSTDDTDAEPTAEELRDGVPMEKGTTYAVIDPTTGTGFSLVSPVDGVYPLLLIGLASMSLDESGNEALMSVYSLDRMRTFVDPNVDIMSIPPGDTEAVTTPIAIDYFAWFSALPGVTVGPVEETTVDGRPGRSMTYQFGPGTDGVPCDGTSLDGCLFTLWNPAGSVAYYAPNDAGTLYETVVDESRAMIDVSSRPGAQEMFETLHFLLEDEG